MDCEQHIDRPFQFSLKEMLITVAALCVTFGVARVKGIAILVTPIGLLLCWVNASGRMSALYTNRSRSLAISVGIIIYALSFVLPVRLYSMSDDDPLTQNGVQGWYFAAVVAKEQLTVFSEVLYVNTYQNILHRIVLLVGVSMLNIANAIMCAAPALAWCIDKRMFRWVIWLFALGVNTAWLAGAEEACSHPVYFVWCSSLTLPLLVCRISVRMWWAMMVYSAVCIAATFWF